MSVTLELTGTTVSFVLGPFRAEVALLLWLLWIEVGLSRAGVALALPLAFNKADDNEVSFVPVLLRAVVTLLV